MSIPCVYVGACVKFVLDFLHMLTYLYIYLAMFIIIIGFNTNMFNSVF